MSFNSKIGIGSAQFGIPYGISNVKGKTTSEEVLKILNLAENLGIYTLDTAAAYGDAEDVLGKYNLSKFMVVSKFMPPENEQKISNQLFSCLTKLKTTSIYGFLAHRPLNLNNNPWQWDELKELRSEGLIRKIGFSLNEPSELDALLTKGIIPDLIQVPFNYFDRRFVGQMIKLKERGCEIHTRSSFLQGLFFADMKKLSTYFDEVKPIIKSMQESIAFLSGSLLRFVIEQPFIDKVIIGVENSNQLLVNLETIEQSSELPELINHVPEKILLPSKWPQ